MIRSTFKKGIHPAYHKNLTCHKKTEILLPGKELVLPLTQHIGNPAIPVVKKGEYVQAGQLIARPDGFISASLHASVSGTVKAIEPHMTYRGIREDSIIIENDGQYQQFKTQEAPGSIAAEKSFTREALIKCLSEAGLTGLGGAAFPTHVKLSIPHDKKIEYIIINGAECEPYLTADHRLMLEQGEEITGGLKILSELFKEAEVVIAIEDNKMDAYEHMKQLTQSEKRIHVRLLKTKYPQGAEKQLIYSVTKREVPSGKLPADTGCLVQNVATMAALYEAVVKREPVTKRIVTVSGSGVRHPCNLQVRIGTPIRRLLEYAGCDYERTVKIIAGGPMMGIAVFDKDVPVMKGTSGILCLTEKEISKTERTHCIRCARCVAACPMGLMPYELYRLAMKGQYQQFEKEHGMNCIECGCCSYICPAKRELVQSIKMAKAATRSLR